MKKFIFVFVIVFAFMASVLAQSVGSDARFSEIFNKALLLNENRFADVNKIAIGDTVYFPARAGDGVEYWIADYPSYGVHDCIWRLTSKYLDDQLPTVNPVIADTTSVVVTPVINEPDIKELWWGIWVALGVAFFIAIILMTGNRRGNNVINAHPVLPGGLSNDPLVAKNQIQAIDPGRQIVKAEHGQLIGSTPTKVTMSFSDKSREVNLVNGDYAYRVTEFDGTVSYWRRHCGNLIHPIASGRFNLPIGWSFVPVSSKNSTWSAPDPETEKSESEKVEPITEKTISDFEGLAKVLEASGKMKYAPSKITFGEFVIEFQSLPKSGQR